MVTNEELAKIVKESWDKSKKEFPLEERSDDELKQLAERLRIERKALRKDLSNALNHYWDIKTSMGEKDKLMKKALVIKGQRKGKYCPAHKKESDALYGRPQCEARRGWQHFYDNDEMYRKYCSTCKLLPKTIQKRITFKRVFETKRKNES